MRKSFTNEVGGAAFRFIASNEYSILLCVFLCLNYGRIVPKLFVSTMITQ